MRTDREGSVEQCPEAQGDARTCPVQRVHVTEVVQVDEGARRELLRGRECPRECEQGAKCLHRHARDHGVLGHTSTQERT